jgi:hypothetical protein
MGLLYLALGILVSGLVYAGVKTWLGLREHKAEQPPEISSRRVYSEYWKG